jgi:hypothetical protein
MISRDALMLRGWRALAADPDAPFVTTGRPRTLVWLWALAGDVLKNAADLRAYDTAAREQWVDVRAGHERKGVMHSIDQVLAICAELKVWDLDLGVVGSSELDKLARQHLSAAAHLALSAMVPAMAEAEMVTPGLRELVKAAAAAEVTAAPRDDVSFQDAAERRARADHFFEAVTVYLEGSGIAEPEDLARSLISHTMKEAR